MLAAHMHRIGVTFLDVWRMTPREAYATADALASMTADDDGDLAPGSMEV